MFQLLKSIFHTRDKSQNVYRFSQAPFLFGRSTAGKRVNEFTAMQTTAVYACVRILAESIAGLPLHVYAYRGAGRERVPGHPLFSILHDICRMIRLKCLCDHFDLRCICHHSDLDRIRENIIKHTH